MAAGPRGVRGTLGQQGLTELAIVNGQLGLRDVRFLACGPLPVVVIQSCPGIVNRKGCCYIEGNILRGHPTARLYAHFLQGPGTVSHRSGHVRYLTLGDGMLLDPAHAGRPDTLLPSAPGLLDGCDGLALLAKASDLAKPKHGSEAERDQKAVTPVLALYKHWRLFG